MPTINFKDGEVFQPTKSAISTTKVTPKIAPTAAVIPSYTKTTNIPTSTSPLLGTIQTTKKPTTQKKGILESAFDKEDYVTKFKKGDIGGGLANLAGATITSAQSVYLNAVNQLASVLQGKGIQPLQYQMSYEEFEKAAAERSGVKPTSEIIKEQSPVLGYIYKLALEIGTDPLELTPIGFLNDIKAAKGIGTQTTKGLDKISQQATTQMPIQAPTKTIEPVKAEVGIKVPEPLKQVPSESLYKDIPLAKGEQIRGMSKNVATDMNMRPEIVQSFRESPDIYRQVSNKESLGKAERIYSGGFKSSYDNLVSAIASDMVKPEHVPLARMIANDAARAGDIDTARKIISDISVKLTEAGQLSQAAKILRNSDPMAVVETIQKYINKINGEFGNRKGWKNFSLKDSEIEAFSKIDIGDTKAIEEAIYSVGNRIAQEWNATGFEKFDELRRIAMLLNPKTQLRNIIGNVPILLERKLANKTSALIQKALPVDKRTQALFIDENSKSIAKELYNQNKEELFSTNKWDSADLRHIISSERKVFKTKPLESGRLLTYNLLQKGDVPFLKSAFIDRASSYIASQGYQTIDDVPLKVINEAKQQALKATYRDASTIATMINKYKRKGGLGSKAVEATLPFVTTPINLARRAVDYSPFGMFKVLSSKDLPDMASKIDTLSQSLVGTGVLALGGYLAKNNISIASPPENKDKSAYQKATGILPYSISTPVGSFTYDWAQPVGSQLAMGVEAYNAYKNATENGQDFTFDDFVRAISSAGYALGDTVLNTSVYQNIIDLFEGYGSPTEKLSRNLINYPLQVIPTISGQLTRTIDPYVRTQYDPTSETKSIASSVKAKVPVASKQLPISIDIWGNEIKRVENVPLRAAQEFLNPAQYSAKKTTKKDIVISDLYDKTGSNKVFPSKAPYTVSYNNQTYKLTPIEISKFQKTMGTYSRINVDKLINTDKFRNTKSAEDKIDMLDKVYRDGWDTAKSEFLENRGI